MIDSKQFELPAPIVVNCRDRNEDSTPPSGRQAGLPSDGRQAGLLDREWLISNKLGSYASSTLLGVNTRKYHGLLVAATNPPGGRIVTLNYLLDRVILVDTGECFELTMFEFDGAFRNENPAELLEFRNDLAAKFLYQCGQVRLVKEIILAERTNTVAVRWSLIPARNAGVELEIQPFVSFRDYHGLVRTDGNDRMTYLRYHDGIEITERTGRFTPLHVSVNTISPDGSGVERLSAGRFTPGKQWWYRFRYRADIARGYDGIEDLFTPGFFRAALSDRAKVQLTASLDGAEVLDFDAELKHKRHRLLPMIEAMGTDADVSTCRLAVAADAFIVMPSQGRKSPADSARKADTIVAGYHWFIDWGRDAMIALPGLLLETGQFVRALNVLRTFAGAMEDGLIPNCFDERTGKGIYNSIDASLWFIIAADKYVRASGDEQAWRDELSKPVEQIIEAYCKGTRFGIHVDSDGLVTGGDEGTQLTWMDATCEGKPITPRWGKCVEVNALWYKALKISASRSKETTQAMRYSRLAEKVARAFPVMFWNERTGCLYDCVNERGKDASVRPNQVIVLALADSLLSPPQRESIIETVQQELLTPYGLRTLSPRDPAYKPRYEGDDTYHQGTVWPWLMGFFIEAYLKVYNFSPDALQQADDWLKAFDEHLSHAGVGFISEIFDGDPPHEPAGCIAQAWSVGEILRAKRLIQRYRNRENKK